MLGGSFSFFSGGVEIAQEEESWKSYPEIQSVRNFRRQQTWAGLLLLLQLRLPPLPMRSDKNFLLQSTISAWF